jgi:hypothetical protein
MLTKIREIVRSLISFLSCSKKTLVLIAIVAISSVAVTTTISIMFSKISNFTLPTLGTVKTIGVEVYWDQNLENRTETIDWDEIWVGSSKNVTVYVRSISNHQIFLNLDARDWDPTAVSGYMDISWDYDGTLLNPGETIPVTLTLTIPSSHSFVSYLIENDVQNFNVDIHILAATE